MPYASGKRTLSILYNHFQHDGISAWWQLLERLCSTNNHVLDIASLEDFEYLAAGMRLAPERLRAILLEMASLKAIDKELYESGLIWSQNLIDRLAVVYKSRGQLPPSKPALLVKQMELLVPETPTEKGTKGTKESKEHKKQYGEFHNVLLTDDEVIKLKEKFNSSFQEKIERLSEYIESKGKKYSSHYATILAWARRDTTEGGYHGTNAAYKKQPQGTSETPHAIDGDAETPEG